MLCAGSVSRALPQWRHRLPCASGAAHYPSADASLLVCWLIQRFEEEADGAESVVAGDHGGLRVFHPAVVEILAAVREREDERGDGVPGAVAEPFRARPAVADEDLAELHFAGVLDRVFVLRDQVVMPDDLLDRDPDFFHRSAYAFTVSAMTPQMRSMSSAFR